MEHFTASKPNTKITYLYRDASNYKIWEEVVVSGHISFAEIEPCLDGGFFIASQVGLPDLQGRWGEMGYDFPSDDDHVYVEIDADDIHPTADAPTVALSASELLDRFKQTASNGWDVVAAAERLGIS